ncbi:MAG: FtsW/RodA/SpoVE family cell cycle protein [Clostridia bacterium]|nr:FtsW/RodA/SpoVE family cell cycle protein [Clostridia bacterium]
MLSRIKAFIKYIRDNKFDRSLMKYFDWPLLINVLAISLFGVVCIFSATSSQVTETPANVIEMLETQSVTYPRLQLLWIGAGMVAMAAIIFFPYQLYERYANVFYAGNIVLLSLTLLIAQAGRGGMTAFFNWGSDRGFQPSEVGKIAIIIALAKAFCVRTKPIMTMHDIIPLAIYIGIPLVLIVAQPDVGTALVYLAVFCVMVFVSGTNSKLIWGVIGMMVLLLIPLWYFMNNSASGNFRFTRILMWLDPESYPDEARQIINGQIAIGSGGIWGKGIVSPGSFASLGYISDDHTDFIFAIVCESFGLVGGMALIFAYVLLVARLIILAMRTKDPYGSYLIVGVLAMFLFHIVENICMVIGLLPVTGIPLPFVSYGGSNMLTNMMGIGLVMNVVMRSRQHEQTQRVDNDKTMQLKRD